MHGRGESPRGVRVPLLGEGNAAPFGAPHGVGRPARARSRLTARFQHSRWAWPSPGSDRGHERSLCRWADPRAARDSMLARHEGAGAAPRSAVSCHRWRPRVSGVGEPYAWRLLPRQPRTAPQSVNTGGEFFQRSSTSEPGIQLIQLGYVCYRTQLPWISSVCCCNLARRRAISVGWQSGPPGSCQRQVSSPRSPMTGAVFLRPGLIGFQSAPAQAGSA